MQSLEDSAHAALGSVKQSRSSQSSSEEAKVFSSSLSWFSEGSLAPQL